MKYQHPIPVTNAIKKLGRDIKNARRRRRISTQLMADRANISRTTLGKIETGELSVSLGNYATVLFVLGMIDKLASLMDISQDTVGLDLEDERLPKRIRTRRHKD